MPIVEFSRYSTGNTCASGGAPVSAIPLICYDDRSRYRCNARCSSAVLVPPLTATYMIVVSGFLAGPLHRIGPCSLI